MRRHLPALIAVTLAAQDPAALFEKHCAGCHREDSPNRAPLPEALVLMSPDAILKSLESGSMKAQAATLSPAQRRTVAAHLGKGTAERIPVQQGYCAPGVLPTADSAPWNGWGVDPGNSRFQPAAAAGLSAEAIPRLRLKWAFGIPNSPTGGSQPAIVGGRAYFGSADGTVYSVDARSGCIYWTFKAEASVRGAPSVGPGPSSRQAVFFGDIRANVYAVDASTGRPHWKVKVDSHPYARITGAVKLHYGRVYTPVSSVEEVPAANPKYECCTFRGSIAALAAATGVQIWKTYSIPDEPAPIRVNSAGTQLRGPAGGAIWSSPALDPPRRILYTGTGNAYIDPAAPTTNAVLAIHMDTGKLLWKSQLLADDSWTFACSSPDKANCAKPGPDFDIGAAVILARAGNRQLLLVGQKSAVVHALDPNAEGKPVWRVQVGRGSALGGIMWGMAADGARVYVPLSDVLTPAPGGLLAVDLRTGVRQWHVPPAVPACKGTRGCTAALMAAATAIPGAVFSASMDGVLWAHSATDGAPLWQFDTRRDFDTVNGVKAKGASISGSGPVVAGGMVYVQSGYGVLGGMPGNVLLAFEAGPSGQ